MKKALIIYNPRAGIKSNRDVAKEVQSKLENLGYAASIFFLEPEFEQNILSYDFAEVKLVVAVGGDGTVKVAARTIVQNQLTAELVIIPFGSANVVAKTLGLSTNIKTALGLLDGKKTKSIDVGVINKTHYFLVGFSSGYVSEVVTGTTTGLKNRLGFIGYFINLLSRNLKIKRKKFLVMTQNRRFWIKGHSLIIFNACNFFGLKPKKPIDPSDGILNLYVITNKNFWTLLLAIGHFLLYHEPTQYIFSIDNEFFKIRFRRRPKSAQIDGDLINLPREIEIKVLPRILKVVVGK